MSIYNTVLYIFIYFSIRKIEVLLRRSLRPFFALLDHAFRTTAALPRLAPGDFLPLFAIWKHIFQTTSPVPTPPHTHTDPHRTPPVEDSTRTRRGPANDPRVATRTRQGPASDPRGATRTRQDPVSDPRGATRGPEGPTRARLGKT